MFLLGTSISPPVRAAIAVILIVIGIAMHLWGLDVAGGVVLVVAGWQLMRGRRGTGSSR